MRRFWTADPHFGHGNIIKYSGRPYNNTDTMNANLINNYNARVKSDDTCVCVGDFSMRGSRSKFRHWKNRLQGSWVFVHGNHDSNNGVKPTCEYMVAVIGGKRVFVSHCPWWYHHMATYIGADGVEYPTRAWQWPEVQGIVATCDFTICGHVHEKWHVRDWDGMVAINVGVDVNNYMPITDDEVLALLARYQREKRNGTPERTGIEPAERTDGYDTRSEESRCAAEANSQEGSA